MSEGDRECLKWTGKRALPLAGDHKGAGGGVRAASTRLQTRPRHRPLWTTRYCRSLASPSRRAARFSRAKRHSLGELTASASRTAACRFRACQFAPWPEFSAAICRQSWLRSSEQFPRFDKCRSAGFEVLRAALGLGRREGVARPEVQPQCGGGNFMRRPRGVAG